MDASVSNTSSGLVSVANPGLYSAYSRAISGTLSHLELYYRHNAGGESSESKSMEVFLGKIVETVTSLEMKHRFNKDPGGAPTIAASGFPFTYDIRDMGADYATSKERLPKLLPLDRIRDKLLDNLMTLRPDPDFNQGIDFARLEEERQRLQWQFAERVYLESLDLRKQFFYFTPGKLFPVGKDEWSALGKDRRAYRFSWGCWDPETNRPCIHFLLLEQDIHEPELMLDTAEYAQFLRAIEQVGTRAPRMLEALFAQLDEVTSRFLHPKALKRFRLGPIVSPILYKDGVPDGTLKAVRKLLPVFEAAKAKEQDSILFFTTEFVYSYGEHTPSAATLAQHLQRIIDSEGPKLRQVFTIPKTDKPLSLETFVLLSHRLRQHLTDDVVKSIPEMEGAEFLAYNDDKEVDNVG